MQTAFFVFVRPSFIINKFAMSVEAVKIIFLHKIVSKLNIYMKMEFLQEMKKSK